MEFVMETERYWALSTGGQGQMKKGESREVVNVIKWKSCKLGMVHGLVGEISPIRSCAGGLFPSRVLRVHLPSAIYRSFHRYGM